MLHGDDSSAWGKQIEDYINNTIRSGDDVVFPTSDGHILILTERSAYKLSDPHVSKVANQVRELLSAEEFARKGRAATHIDELIQVAIFRKYEPDINNKHENDIGEDGFNYYDSYFMDADGQYYRVRFSSAINENDETAYSIGAITKRKLPTGGGSSSANRGALNGGKLPENGIAYKAESSQEEISAVRAAYEKALKKKQNLSRVNQSEETKAAIEAYRAQATAEAKAMKAVYEAERKQIVDAYKRQLNSLERQYRAEVASIEGAFKSLVRKYQSMQDNAAASDQMVAELTAALNEEAEAHDMDKQLWQEEFARLLKKYDKPDAKVLRQFQKRITKAATSSCENSLCDG